MLRNVTALALIFALLITIAKFTAWIYSGSLTILSSMVDSLFDMAMSAVNAAAAHYSLKPADDDHRHGHGKAEAIASFAQGLLLGVLSIYLIWEGASRLINPHSITHHGYGMAAMIFSIVLTAILLAYQRWVITRTDSLIVKSDSLHYQTDIISNLSALLAIFLTGYFALPMLDSLFGIAIALYMLKGAFSIFRESVDHLMDKELSEPERDNIIGIAFSLPEVLNVNELKTRKSGGDLFIQLHLVLDGSISLAAAQDVSGRLESALLTAFPHSQVIIIPEAAGKSS